MICCETLSGITAYVITYKSSCTGVYAGFSGRLRVKMCMCECTWKLTKSPLPFSNKKNTLSFYKHLNIYRRLSVIFTLYSRYGVFFLTHMKRLQRSLRQVYLKYTGQVDRIHVPVVCRHHPQWSPLCSWLALTLIFFVFLGRSLNICTLQNYA